MSGQADVSPQNLDAEENVLGAILLPESEAIVFVSPIIGAGDAFYRASHGTIYRAALELHANGVPVDAITLCDELERRGELEEIGGRARINELAALVPAAGNAAHYARIIRDKARDRVVLSNLQPVVAALSNGGLEPDEAHAALARASALISEAAVDAGAGHSWTPVDLVGLGEAAPEPPTLSGIVYPGRRHIFSGEPESLKSWAALVLCIEQMRQDRTVMYVDFEMGGVEMLDRLRALGADDELIRDRFLYVEPDEQLQHALPAVETLIRNRQPALVVLDAFTGALALHGLDPNSSIDVEAFYQRVIEPLRAGGAAVVVLDHLPKDPAARGRFAIGSERKVGAADVHLGFEPVQPLARGKTGKVRIVTHKDRPGHLPRPRCGELELASDPASGRITWTLRMPEPGDTSKPFRPTYLMERVSRFVEQQSEPVSRNKVEQTVKGNGEMVRLAIDVLVEEGHLGVEDGPRRAKLLRSIRPYREADGPTSSTPSHLVSTSSETRSSPTSSTSSTPSQGDEVDEDEVRPTHGRRLRPPDRTPH